MNSFKNINLERCSLEVSSFELLPIYSLLLPTYFSLPADDNAEIQIELDTSGKQVSSRAESKFYDPLCLNEKYSFLYRVKASIIIH